MLLGDLTALLKEITDIFSLVRKNYNSYTGLKDDLERRAFLHRLEELQRRLTHFVGSNNIMLGHILTRSSRNAPEKIDLNFQLSYLLDEDEYHQAEAHDAEFQEILSSLTELRMLLEQIAPQLIVRDHELYQRINDAISQRMRIVRFLQAEKGGPFDRERFNELATVYQGLIDNLTEYKTELQKMRNGE